MLRGSYLIIGVNVFFTLGVAVTYALTVSAGHVKLFWCFISYTGNFAVESCIFSAVLNVCSGIYFLIVVLRYHQISEVIQNSELYEGASKSMKRRNLASLVFGSVGSIGLSVTGCFQQRNFYLIHIIGVAFSTCGTNIYFIFQTYFSFTLLSGSTRTFVKVIRLVIVILSSTDLIIGALLLLYHFVTHPRREGFLSATPAVVLSDVYIAGTTLEWLLFLLFQFFIYSFGWDFKRIGLKSLAGKLLRGVLSSRKELLSHPLPVFFLIFIIIVLTEAFSE